MGFRVAARLSSLIVSRGARFGPEAMDLRGKGLGYNALYESYVTCVNLRRVPFRLPRVSLIVPAIESALAAPIEFLPSFDNSNFTKIA